MNKIICRYRQYIIQERCLSQQMRKLIKCPLPLPSLPIPDIIEYVSLVLSYPSFRPSVCPFRNQDTKGVFFKGNGTIILTLKQMDVYLCVCEIQVSLKISIMTSLNFKQSFAFGIFFIYIVQKNAFMTVIKLILKYFSKNLVGEFFS